uniref:beta strand repeat-containing protein n=1 Tax=Pontiella sp. TaxID=2837462 RepID=UPI00356588E6
NDFTCHTQVGAEWATFSQAANFNGVAEGGTFSYAIIDDPTQIPGADVADWGIRSAVASANTPAGAGSWCKILKFDIDATTPSEFRIGIMAGNANNVNWNPSGLRVSVDGGTPAAVTNLVDTIGQANMVFFDVDLNGATSGTFTIEAQRRAATQGASLAGVTFDATSAVTFPDGALALDQKTLSLTLVAPDTSINGTINALYLAGAGATDVEIVSAEADTGFSASYVGSTLGTANTNEAITVSFDNATVGLANGESTNSTLVVTWTEVGSGVTNTSEAALDVTYVNVPSSLALAPTSLSLVLNAGDAGTNGTIAASLVAGTLSTDVEVVSVSAGSGFSAAPTSFTLDTGTPAADITVTFTDPGGLAHDDVVSSSLVVVWTEAGSGVTNTANAALDVTYNDPPDLTEVWTIGIDFGAVVAGNNWNHISVGGNATTLGLDSDEQEVNPDSVGIADLGRLSDGTATGVGFTLVNSTGQIAWDFAGGTDGDGGLIEAAGADVYGDGLISNDQASRVTVSGVDFFLITFTGLDDNLTYGFVSGWDHDNANFDTRWNVYSDNGFTNVTDTFLTDVTGGDNEGYGSFSGLTSSGGELYLGLTGDGGAAQIVLAALTLTAYQEPVTAIGAMGVGVISGGTQVVLSWQGQAGASYGVEATDNLVTGTWTGINTGIAGLDGMLSVTNDITADQQFFRSYVEE